MVSGHIYLVPDVHFRVRRKLGILTRCFVKTIKPANSCIQICGFCARYNEKLRFYSWWCIRMNILYIYTHNADLFLIFNAPVDVMNVSKAKL